MNIGFICPNLPGHINPMTALARRLQAHNQEVVFLYSSSANGLPCIPGPAADIAAAHLRAFRDTTVFCPRVNNRVTIGLRGFNDLRHADSVVFDFGSEGRTSF